MEIILTDEGTLVRRTASGEEVFDFNGQYRGLYPKCRFTAVARCKSGFYLAGLDDTGADSGGDEQCGKSLERICELHIAPRHQMRFYWKSGSSPVPQTPRLFILVMSTLPSQRP